jgi:hypothetical protein
VIYGYTAGSDLGNLVGTRKADGTPDTHIAQRGDVVYLSKSMYSDDIDGNYRDSTLGENESFSSSSGLWDN